MAVITGTEFDDLIDHTYSINGGPPTGANDQINALAGDDRVDGLGGNDDIDGGDGKDDLVGGDGDDHLIGGKGADILHGDLGNDVLEGGSGSDVLYGWDNNDRLDGGAGLDDLVGGLGDDTFIINRATDVVLNEVYNGQDGTDTLSILDEVDISFVKVIAVERLTSTSSLKAQAAQISGKQFLVTGELTFTTSGLVNLAGKQVGTRFFVLNSGGNTLDLTGDMLGYDVVGGIGNDTALGGMGNDVLRGGDGTDVLKGNESNDELTGGKGNDALFGGAGNDTAVFSDAFANYSVTAIAGGGFKVKHLIAGGDGTDVLQEIETLRFTDGMGAPEWAAKGALLLTPPTYTDALDLLIAGGGFNADTFAYQGVATASQLLTKGYKFGATGPLFGSGLMLSTGDGTPPLSNTSPNYSIDNHAPGDSDLDAAAAAAGKAASFDASVVTFNLHVTDPTIRYISLDMIFGSEEAATTSDGDLAAVLVNGLNYALFHNSPAAPLSLNQLFAGGLLNTPPPGPFNIEYAGLTPPLSLLAPVQLGDNAIKIAVGDLGDRTYDSALFIGNLTGWSSGGPGLFLLQRGTSGADDLTGTSLDELFRLGAGNDRAEAGGGNDVLRGEAGNDLLIGGSGAGDDVYDGGTGRDTVSFASATQTVTVNLAAAADQAIGSETGTDQIHGVENVIGGDGADSITGDGADNELTGGGGDDTLNGGAGADTLRGGVGADNMIGGTDNDIYIVDNAGDVVTETGNSGTDLVKSSVTFSLGGKQIENLTLTGSADINGTGNSLANTVTGNAGNNVLNGGSGADTMAGGAGNDTYIVDNASDVVTETANSGIDLVRSSIAFSLAGKQIENLTLTGSADINGTGNSLANTLTGNAGNNVLNGGSGADTLTGLGGSDFFAFNTTPGASNIDTITDFSVANDTIRLENAVFTGLVAGVLAAGAFFQGTSAHDADDRVIYNDTNGALLFDNDGVGAAAAVQFATVSTGLSMISANFFVT